ncbi:MAG: uroporphyrinogen-III C-methyltransferase [Myxococcota bacterium]
MSDEAPAGIVYLVGAGPGDPGLLTLRGAELLRSADAVVYDALVSSELLDLAPPDALRIGVGRRGHEDPPRSQEDVNALLVRLAREGRTVVRLKGGDPFVFGRGGEEASACRAAGVLFEVVPGVSSVLGALAYAGIPLTDRRHASSFTVLTGHKDPTPSVRAMRLEEIARGADTLVVLMGMRNLRALLDRLVECGRPADTPAAAVMLGTTPRQRTVVAPLGQLADAVLAAGLGSPSAVVVGDVVRLRDELEWFEQRPLFGRRVLVTRPAGQNLELVARLRAAGAEPVVVPLIRVVPSYPRALEAALEKLDAYDAVLLTSRPAARLFASRLETRAAAGPHCPEVLCVGPGTAREARTRGLPARVVPGAEPDAEGLVAALVGAGGSTGRRFLFPCAQDAREVVPEGLRAAGARVDVVPVYSTLPEPVDEDWLRATLLGGGLDALCFASPSAVRCFVACLDEEARSAARGCHIVSIGRVTARALADEGLPANATAPHPDDAGLVDALVKSFGGRTDEG